MAASSIENTKLALRWSLTKRQSQLGGVLAVLLSMGVCGAAQAAEETSVDEVVVTAERREGRLVDTPITITALTADQITKAGVDNVLDLGPFVPALRMDKIGASLQPTIRGITSNTSGPGSASNVAIYIDGSYIASQSGANFDFPDVASIQVLKGPQGTLFGRNATGGAIQITTLKPSYTPQAKVTVGMGSYKESLVSGYVTGPITSKLAGMISGGFRYNDGYYTNIYTGSKTDGKYEGWNASAKFLYTFDNSDTVSLLISHSDVNDAVSQVYRVDPNYGLKSTIFSVPNQVIAQDYFKDSMGYKPKSADSVYRASLTAKIGLGDFATLTSHTAYFNEKFVEHSDLDGGPAQIFDIYFTTTNENYSQEFDLVSNSSGPLKWTAGLYFFHEDAARPNQYLNAVGKPTLTNLANNGVITDAQAIFADATYDITPALHLTLGYRYSNETKKLLAILPIRATAKKSWQKGTPRVVLRYDIDPTTNVYASFSQGFKSGNFNPSQPTRPPASPELVDAYEVGFKTQRRGLELSTAAYYYDYTNLQATSYVILPGQTTLTSLLTNAASAEVYGVEADVTYHVTDELTAHFGGAYTHGKYNEYLGAVGFADHPSGIGYINTSFDASGNTMMRSPKLSGNFALSYERDVPWGKIRLGGTVSYSSKLYYDAPMQFVQPAYTLVGLSAEWISDDGKLSAALIGRNVLDKHYVWYVDPITVGILDNDAPPRTWRFTVTYRY